MTVVRGRKVLARTHGQNQLLEHQEVLGKLQLGLHLLANDLGHQADPQLGAVDLTLPLTMDCTDVKLTRAHTASVKLQTVQQTLHGLL